MRAPGFRTDQKHSQCAGAKPTRQILCLSARCVSCALQLLIHGTFTGVSCEVGPGCSHLERREGRAEQPPLLPMVLHLAIPAPPRSSNNSAIDMDLVVLWKDRDWTPAGIESSQVMR